MASLMQRGETFYIQYRASGKIRRYTTGTTSLQIAKEKLRQFESSQLRGEPSPLPTRTPIAQVVTDYVQHMRGCKTGKSAQTDIYYLREIFGPICAALQVTSRRISPAARKRPPLPGQDRRRRAVVIEAPCFEQITTAQVSAFVTGQKESRGLAPKTANRYREILHRLFNWAMEQRGLRLPGDRNPVAKVERYKESAPEIRFLTLSQVADQLAALNDRPQLQVMVAMLIYAGLRREELLWLTHSDIDLNTGPLGMIRIRAKTIDGVSWQPKPKRNRAVPISRALRHYLEQYRPRIVPHEWYFPSPQGQRWDGDNFSQDLAAVNQRPTCHGPAWTFATPSAVNLRPRESRCTKLLH